METKVDYPDDQLLSPKQIAIIAKKPRNTVYEWLRVAPPQNAVVKGSRVAYKASDVKVWLEAKEARKAPIHILRASRRMALAIIDLKETDNTRYLAILALLQGTDD